MYFNVNSNVFFKLINVQLLVSELCIIRPVGSNIFKVPISGMLRVILAIQIFCHGSHSNRV